MDNYRRTGVDVGNCIQCEGGYFPAGDGGGSVFDNDGKKIKSFTGKEYGGSAARGPPWRTSSRPSAATNAAT